MNTINQNIFNTFFSLSIDPNIASISLFVSNILIYILFGIVFLYIVLRSKFIFPHLFMAIGASGGAWVVSKIIKYIIHIDRPFVALGLTPLFYESGFSFPSSHSAVFAALSTVVFALNRKLGILMIFCTIFIGLSRMVLGVHYPLDIVGGYAAGVIVGLVFLSIMKSRYAVAFFGKSL
ncbi:phosphatase PAP2 family protein [Candidatus Nomurabacteria bacterium]|nr:phosphatase PAP2 family protein [Candidatus Nomurabacteria bacterium]